MLLKGAKYIPGFASGSAHCSLLVVSMYVTRIIFYVFYFLSQILGNSKLKSKN